MSERRAWQSGAGVALLLLLALAACAGPQTRVERGLTEAGVKPARAECMAEILVDRLSLAQLRKLGRLGKLREEAGEDATIGWYLKNAEAFRDPEILQAAGEALSRCSLR